MNSYAKLIGIDLKHSYYSDGWCTDFDVVPSEKTKELLRNHRCTTKSRLGGINIYVEVDANGKPLIPFTKNDSLNFILSLRNPEFLLFTDETPLHSSNECQVIYPEKRSCESYLGVAIHRDLNQLSGSDYQLSFSAKKMMWVYYLITDRSDADADYAINAADPQVSWRLDSGGDKLHTKLVEQYPGKRVLRFSSNKLLPCSDKGTSGTHLTVAGLSVADNLPNPSWRNFFKTRMAATGDHVDAMFHIVKYLSNTSLTKV